MTKEKEAGKRSRRQKTKDQSVLLGSRGRLLKQAHRHLHKRWKRADWPVRVLFISRMSEVNMDDYLAVWFAVFDPDRETEREQ